MLTSRRDYLLRMVEEVTLKLARVIFHRKAGNDEEALEGVVSGCERLFGVDRDRLFQFTPDQQRTVLVLDIPPADAAAKLDLYAALNREAGLIYEAKGKTALASGCFRNALSLVLHARLDFPGETPLECSPKIEELRAHLKADDLNPEIEEMLGKIV